MKTFIITILLFLVVINANSQQFSKIEVGEIVNTPSGSRSCNFIDIDNDGFQDILITNGKSGGENNMLYLNNAGESFSLLDEVISNDNTPSDGASCADYDNDGFTDVFVVNWYNIDNLLYRNNGDVSFSQVDTGIIATAGGYSETASWGDADNDGFVDLYISNSDGDKLNYFLRNTGAGSFEQVFYTSPSSDSYYSRCVNWIDFDNDGDQDIYVTNESNQQNNLYRNEGNFDFTKVTQSEIVSDNYSSMSSSWADYDNDGDFDLFVSNYQQHNQLFKNEGNGSFTEVAGPWDSDLGCSFSSSFGDYDNDGDLDIFITNGYCSFNLNNYLYSNNGDGTFVKITDEAPAIDLGNSFGCAWGDYNNDGFIDLVVANWQNEIQHNYLYKNNSNDNNWLKVKLEGTESNRSAIGAKVKCKARINGEFVWQTREISAQTGYCSQNSLVAHFGVADATIIDSLQVIWSSGTIQNRSNLNVNQQISLVEGVDTILVNEIIITGENNSTTIDEFEGTLQMLATVFPENASNKAINWSIENGLNIASITENGLLQATGIADGIVTVKAMAIDISETISMLEITISNQSISNIKELEKNFTLYPNPVRDFLIIQGHNFTSTDIYIEILNVYGKVVFNSFFKPLHNTIRLDLSGLISGIYIMRMTNSDIEEFRKIIIN